MRVLTCGLCFRPLPCELDMDGRRVRAVSCGTAHTACQVSRAWVSDDLIKNCMACKNKFSLVNRKVCVLCYVLFCFFVQKTCMLKLGHVMPSPFAF